MSTTMNAQLTALADRANEMGCPPDRMEAYCNEPAVKRSFEGFDDEQEFAREARNMAKDGCFDTMFVSCKTTEDTHGHFMFSLKHETLLAAVVSGEGDEASSDMAEQAKTATRIVKEIADAIKATTDTQVDAE